MFQDRDSKALPYTWDDVVRCHDSSSLDLILTIRTLPRRLSILDDPARDKNSVQETANLLPIVD